MMSGRQRHQPQDTAYLAAVVDILAPCRRSVAMFDEDELPLISFVVAMTPAHIIGRDGQLPWHIPADLAHFRRMTMGKPVLMGRRTFEAIGRPLPERHNIVVTRDRGYVAGGCTVACRMPATQSARRAMCWAACMSSAGVTT